MKALEILKNQRNGVIELMHTADYNIAIDEAIAELEALQDEVKDAEWRLDLCLAQQRAMQEHKTCDGCKWLTQYGCNVCAICKRNEKCLDRYEPKEQL